MTRENLPLSAILGLTKINVLMVTNRQYVTAILKAAIQTLYWLKMSVKPAFSLINEGKR